MKSSLRLSLIILLAVCMRCVNLESVPVWMWDEGGNINYASNLMEGRVQLFGYKYHFIPHPPLYFVYLAPFFKILGSSILVLRLSSVVLSMFGLILVYMIVRDVLGESSALCAALFYAIFPELVFWGRLGFANNLLSVMVLTSIFLLYRHVKTGAPAYLAYASVMTGLCVLVEYTGVVFLMSLWIMVYWISPSSIRKVFLLSVAPIFIFTLLMLVFDGGGFMADAVMHFARYPLFLPVLLLGAVIFRKYSVLIRSRMESAYLGLGVKSPAELVVLLMLSIPSTVPLDWHLIVYGRFISSIFLISLISILFIEDKTFKNILLVYSGGYLLLMLVLNRSDHMVMPLAYIASLAPAFLFIKAYDFASKSRGMLVLLSIPLLLVLAQDIEGFALKGMYEMPLSSVTDLTGYVNERAGPGSLIVSFNYLSPMLDGDVVIFPHVLAYYGHRFSYWRRDYSPSDFAHNHSLDGIDYMILPAGLTDEFDDLQYSGLMDDIGEWDTVYELRVRQLRNPPVNSWMLGILGSPLYMEHHYVVLENPRLG
ncbi:MAG: glycosyltransferase family 39 protein [Candidatus Altiarchaeota archaeon]